VFQKFAGPDEIILQLGNERAGAEVVLDDMIGNEAVLNRLPAAVDFHDFAIQIVKELGRIDVAATDLEPGLNLKFLDRPRQQQRRTGQDRGAAKSTTKAQRT